MERLAEWTGEEWIPRQEKLNGKYIGHKACMKKLAEYEATDLSPDEVETLKGAERKRMGKLSKRNMEELREHCSLGCEYSGTEEMVSEIVTEVLTELGSDLTCGDEIGLTNDEEFATIDDFVRAFWEKAVEAILNVVETQN